MNARKTIKKTILSLEQALALPYATQRFVQLGWRVIRIEAAAEEGQVNPGDPNRYVGAMVDEADRRSYYIAPNVGKEAITLNLKTKGGRQLLLRLIENLRVDAFLCNTLPKRYSQLGIDFPTLSRANPKLIWCGISAMGPKYPDVAGYDPALQALMGFTYLTGEEDGVPVPCGIPVIDLKAGDEAFTQVVLAFLQQEASGGGKEIHVSMAQCAASWLISALPQLAFTNGEDEIKRSGNEHRSFVPCNAYPTTDGYVYLAIGNDMQWAKFSSHPDFVELGAREFRTNEGRRRKKQYLHERIGEVSRKYSTKEFVKMCQTMGLSVAPINSIKQVAELDFVRQCTLRTGLPSGNEISLSPPSTDTEFLKKAGFFLNYAPRLGEHTVSVLREAGITEAEISRFKRENVI